MKYFVISSPRCGGHYCGEAIALRTQVLPLGECLNSMYKDDVYTFDNNQVQVNWPEKEYFNKINSQGKNNSSITEVTNRLDNLLEVDNWQGQAHLGHLEHLENNIVEKIVNNTNAILLYRENYIESIISWIIAFELDLWVPRGSQKYKAVYYNKEKHLPSVKQLIQEYDNLQKLANKYKWHDVFKYEDFTGDHNIDFVNYKLQQQTTTWSLPVKNNPESNKKKILKNVDELLKDLKWNG